MAGRIEAFKFKIPSLPAFGVRPGQLASNLVQDARKIGKMGILLGSRPDRNSPPQLVFSLETNKATNHLQNLAGSIEPTVSAGHLRVVPFGNPMMIVAYYLTYFFNSVEFAVSRDLDIKKGILRIDKLISSLNENEYPGDCNIFNHPDKFLEFAESFVTSLDAAYMKTLDSIIRDIGPSRTSEIMRSINRGDFIPPHAVPNFDRDKGIPSKFLYFVDMPLFLNKDYNASRISTVSIVLDALDIKEGMKVLEVGTGSGWPTALIAKMVGEKGKVYSMETNRDLYAWAKKVVALKGFRNVEFKHGSGFKGWSSRTPFDRIVVWGTVEDSRDFDIFFGELKEGGRLIVPAGDDITIIDKKESVSVKNLRVIQRLANNWFGELEKRL